MMMNDTCANIHKRRARPVRAQMAFQSTFCLGTSDRSGGRWDDGGWDDGWWDGEE